MVLFSVYRVTNDFLKLQFRTESVLPSLTTSYMSISLVRSIMKLFERVIEQRLRSHLENIGNPILPRGGGAKYTPLLFLLHHPKTAQGIKLKLSAFKDTILRHILQVKPVC